MTLRAGLALAALMVCAGCRGTGAMSAASSAAVPAPAATTALAKPTSGLEAAKDPTASTALPPAATAATTQPATANPGSSANPTKPAGDAAQLAAILHEVQQVGTLDAAAQQALLEDLQKTDPALWPQLVQVFKASVAYRKQVAERAARENAASSQPSETFVQTPPESPTTIPPPSTLATVEPTPVPLPIVEEGALAPQIPFANVAAAYPSEAVSDIQLASASEPVRGNFESARPNTNPTDSAAAPPNSKPTISAASPDDAHQHLAAAIRALEAAANEQGEASDSAANNSATNTAARDRLRLLYLAANRRDDALKSIAGLPGAQQEFWSEELFGLATLLDAESLPDESRRAATAARHLRDAAEKLSHAAPLGLKNLAFCTEVTSYGVFKPFAKYEFKPGQELLLYAEVENFVSEATAKGFRTALKSSYHILDNRGARVAEQDFALTEEHCRNVRRDFFIRYFIYLPKRIYNGEYTLQLTIEDTLGNKVGQSNIAFTIAGEE